MTAKFIDNPLFPISDVESVIIEIIDPCIDPTSVLATDQGPPSEYKYTGDTPRYDKSITPFQVTPDACSFTYSCEMIGGPRLDLCDIIDGSTQGSFNTATGDYFFQSTDVFAFEPGTYEFRITGTVGIQSDTATFSLILVDRCPESTFFLKSNPFSNETYYLRDQQIEKIWTVDDLAEIVMPYNCGAITTEFFYEDTSPFDTSIFNDLRTGPNSFQVLYTESLNDVGIYEITYRV